MSDGSVHMENKEEELVEFFVVNKELPMSSGKLGAQIGHGATIIAVKYGHTEPFKEWFSMIQKKILLEGKEKDLLRLIEQGFEPVRDVGCNEVPLNSLTVVALPPMKRKDAKPFIKRLQLLKER